MSWTYSGDPSASPLDQVRFLCGDTKTAEPFLQDEEINFLITLKENPRAAAHEACMMILAKLSEEVDFELGPQKVKASQRFEQYRKFFETRRTLLISSYAQPSWDDQGVNAPAIFDIGLHDNSGGDY
jgi:hypothetical protein